MDYLAPLGNNLAYSLAVEKLLGIDVPEQARFARVVLAELQRIASHLVWLGTSALDLGAQSVFLYCFRERELILDIFEVCSGVRMMTSYIMPGGLRPICRQTSSNWCAASSRYSRRGCANITTCSPTTASGSTARTASACCQPSRRLRWGAAARRCAAAASPMTCARLFRIAATSAIAFDIPIGANGDVYDRYLMRMLEMSESLKIIQQAMDGMPEGRWQVDDPKIVAPQKYEVSSNMEALIHHFKLYTEGYRPPAGEVYRAYRVAARASWASTSSATAARSPIACTCARHRSPIFRRCR